MKVKVYEDTEVFNVNKNLDAMLQDYEARSKACVRDFRKYINYLIDNYAEEVGGDLEGFMFLVEKIARRNGKLDC